MKKKLCIISIIIIFFTFTFTYNLNEKKQLTSIINYQINEKDAYTPDSYNEYLKALNYAKTIKNEIYASKEDINDAKIYLQNTINNLYPKPDKTNLKKKYNEALTIDNQLYIPLSINKLQQSINKADKTIKNDNALLEDINKSIEEIECAIESLIKKPNKTKLNEIIEKANKIKEDKYTTTSYNNLKKEITLSNNIYKDENSTQEKVDETIEKLQSSINNLKIATNGVYRIYVNTYKLSNNHVGNEWNNTITYNGKKIYSYETITAPIDSKYITLKATIVEEDKIKDVGTGYITILLKDKNKKSQKINVIENRGRYYGNIATWEFSCSIELIEKK